MDNLLRKIKKLIPKRLYRFFQPVYHYLLALTGALLYRFPAKKLKIVGITGTKGKSTTVELINSVLEEAGFKTALTSTIHFKIGEKTWTNKYKMSMPGRFFMQKFLHNAVKAKCDWVILEMTSEGAKQFRHKFIKLDALIFTNLHKEHIESHGSFENYREAKLRLLDNLRGTLIVNEDDSNSNYFIKKNNGVVTTFSLEDAKPFELSNGIKMKFDESTFSSKLVGEFNIYNILAAATFAKSIDIDYDVIENGIEKVEEVKGRAQFIRENQNFDVVVDYAHTPDSLEALYKAFPNKKICVLGNTGGGRDKWKRPEMAKIADEYCDHIVLTNEDPYDEDPLEIIGDMKESIINTPLEVIIDRKEAIKRAVSLANEGDTVLITGKGTDPYIMEANNTKTPWSDAKVTREILKNL
ncbi:MAG: UDP-N-acetylmuramoyl-L-alanyl-D-glutamate--2,6-diaminopimelate ligase [Candidatus Paceibacteria bacterium]|jgi:UDP-N-acetylmuramoyl-L-alanyl-D-glutamate--2,6-diaminopimelate ligase